MARCHNIQRCSQCGRLLIHKGSRSQHESASYFGQIVHNLIPQVFTFIDIDGALYRRSTQLLRFFEHKSPGQHRKPAQQELLKMLAQIIEHIKLCPTAQAQFKLNPRSGCFLIEGDPHEGNQLGSSVVTNLLTGDSKVCNDELALLSWVALLEGSDRGKIADKLSRRRCLAKGLH